MPVKQKSIAIITDYNGLDDQAWAYLLLFTITGQVWLRFERPQ